MQTSAELHLVLDRVRQLSVCALVVLLVLGGNVVVGHELPVVDKVADALDVALQDALLVVVLVTEGHVERRHGEHAEDPQAQQGGELAVLDVGVHDHTRESVGVLDAAR